MAHKHFLLFILCISITFSVSSQVITKISRKGVDPVIVTKTSTNNPSYSLLQLQGKWQEVYRTDDKTNSSASFSDTLFYYFSNNNQVFSRDGVNMSLIGEADIDQGNVLTAAADVFTIRSLKNNKIILDDGEQTHTLIKKNNFWYESLPSNVVAPVVYTTPVITSTSMLAGKWKVYRRDAAPGSKTGAVLIRMLNINKIDNEQNASGEITFYQTDKFETQPCTIILADKKIHIKSKNNSWQMNIYKADGKELVFGDGSLMYYCKQL